MSSYNWPPSSGGGGVIIYPSASDFPIPSTNIGDLAVAADTGGVYEWRGASWQLLADPVNTPLAITALTGDVTASGPGAVAATLATVNVSPGSFGSASQSLTATVNGKGLITTLSAQNIQIAESQVTNLVSDLAGKQPIGNYITALTGDGTASGPGSSALTLATVNVSPGSFGSASDSLSATVNGKGLITSLASQSIQIAESQVTNLVSDLAGKQPTGNYITALTGDGSASGPGSAALTLATVNSNVGSFTNASITVNGKGLITAASNGTSLVTAVSVSSANGFAGSSSGGATPALTLSTSVTGVLKGNGTALSAATTTNHNVLIGAGAADFTNVAPSATSGVALVSTGASSDPAFGTTVVAGGGTGVVTTTAYGLITGGTTATGNFQNAGTGSTSQVLVGAGSSALPTWGTVPSGALATASFVAPTIQKFTSGSGTYTTPTSPRSPVYIRVRMVGGGGGGSGSGTSGGGATTSGGNTTFGTALLVANGGVGGSVIYGNGGNGGTASLASPAIGTVLTGGAGAVGVVVVTSGDIGIGGIGGSNPLGGAGAPTTSTGGTAAANTGGGGAGGTKESTGSTSYGGEGGGAGGFVDVIIPSLLSTYNYAVGAPGSAGTAGGSGSAGGAGAAGYIEVTEYYQ